MPVSLAPNPVPVSVIVAPGAAFVLLAEMLGVAMKVRSGAELADVEPPLASMVWFMPEAAAGMTILALQLPRESAEMPEPAATPSKVTIMPVSLAAKPAPEIVTEVPTGPLKRLADIPGVTVKVVLPVLVEVVPVALTV